MTAYIICIFALSFLFALSARKGARSNSGLISCALRFFLWSYILFICDAALLTLIGIGSSDSTVSLMPFSSACIEDIFAMSLRIWWMAAVTFIGVAVSKRFSRAAFALFTAAAVFSAGSFAAMSWAESSLCLNEICSVNLRAIYDEYGYYRDYVELYNPTPFPVSLEGYCLTDNLDKEPLSVAQGVAGCDALSSQGMPVVEAHDCAVIWTDTGEQGFGISAKGSETIYLLRTVRTGRQEPSAGDVSDLVILDQVTVPAMNEGEVYAWDRQSGSWELSSPSPLKSNAAAMLEYQLDGDELIYFSQDSAMYDDTVTLELKKDERLPDSAEIYYTLNGDDPTSEEGILYTGPIILKSDGSCVVYPVKAAVCVDGACGTACERTFIICDDVGNEWDTDIVCITADSSSLYDYDTGILVRGRTYDEYVAAYGESGAHNKGNFRNRGSEWIRDGHVVMFDADGAVLLDQDVGIGVSGGTSSSMDVKSLKLYAGSIYDDAHDTLDLYLENPGSFDDFDDSDNSDNYDISDSTATPLSGTGYSPVYSYRSIRLRSGGQDMDTGNIRSSVVSRLACESGFDGISSTTRCMVFLNGEFYGIFDIQQNFSSDYLADRFGLPDPDAVEKIKQGEVYALSSAGLSELFNLDLNVEENRVLLEEQVDMDSYLLCFAIEILCNNTDWSSNNFEIWRYTGEADENNPYTDGRYRFLIYDVDLCYPTDGRYEWFEGSNGDLLEDLMEGTTHAEGSTFPSVMASDYYRERFICLVSGLLDTTFSTDHVLQIVDEEDAKISSIREEFCGEEYAASAEAAVDEMRQAVIARPDEIAELFEKYFDVIPG